jgi:hypothetical protein
MGERAKVKICQIIKKYKRIIACFMNGVVAGLELLIFYIRLVKILALSKYYFVLQNRFTHKMQPSVPTTNTIFTGNRVFLNQNGCLGTRFKGLDGYSHIITPTNFSISLIAASCQAIPCRRIYLHSG